jgi:hypothetical protein
MSEAALEDSDPAVANGAKGLVVGLTAAMEDVVVAPGTG